MPKTAIAVANTTKPASAERKTAVERPHENLTQTQEQVADIASDILLNGGAREDLELVLGALARHHYRNMSFSRGPVGCGSLSAAQLDARATAYATRIREDWYRDLAKHWPGRKAEAEGSERLPVARPVTEMVRANIRASAQAQFEQFLTDTDGIEPIMAAERNIGKFQRRPGYGGGDLFPDGSRRDLRQGATGAQGAHRGVRGVPTKGGDRLTFCSLVQRGVHCWMTQKGN